MEQILMMLAVQWLIISPALKPTIYFYRISMGNPALIITSVLFGLVHGLQINTAWDMHFNWFEFLNTFLLGWLLGWMTIKNGSILWPILTHNILNTLPKAIFWTLSL